MPDTPPTSPEEPAARLFVLPSLLDVNSSLSPLAADPEMEPPPWFGWAGEWTMRSLVYGLLPLLRSLDLAGYRATSVELGLRGAGEGGSDGWIRCWLGPLLASREDTSIEQTETGRPFEWGKDDESADYQTVFAVRVSGRPSVAMRDLAIPWEAALLPLPTDFNVDGAFLKFPSATTVAENDDVARAIADSQVGWFVDQMIEGLAERWTRSGAGDLGPLDPYDFTTAPGLLWLFDPTFWETDPPAWTGDAGTFCRDFGTKLKAVADADPEAFLRTQILNHARRKDWRAATVVGLLESEVGFLQSKEKNARFPSREFFRLVGARNVELGGPIDPWAITNLTGNGFPGFESQVRYLEVLMLLANARVFPFPALPDPLVPSADDWEGEPFEVTLVSASRTGKPIGVDIRVFGEGPVTISCTVDLGYPYDRCFSWEYRAPDTTGTARLIVVAAPGVRIDGSGRLPRSCRLVVYRVQDHELVPAWGERIVEALYTAPEDREAYYWRDRMVFSEEPLPEGQEPVGFSAEPEPAFRIQPQATGCRICYPALASPEVADLLIDITPSETSPDERFSFAIEPGEHRAQNLEYNTIDRHTLTILVTPKVRIEIIAKTGIRNFVDCTYWRTRESNPALVPPPGEPLDRTYLESVAVKLVKEDEWFKPKSRLPAEYVPLIGAAKFLGQMGADVGIGMIPVVGDAVDVIEFAQSFATGTDKWGEPVTNFDRAIMFGCILLPFVSSGAVRGLAKAAP